MSPACHQPGVFHLRVTSTGGQPSTPPSPRPAFKQPQRGRKAPRPLPPGEQFFTPGATGLRKTVETRSAPLLVYLYQLPKIVLPILLVAFFIGGFAFPDWRGGLCMLPVIAFTGWLAYLSWPSLRHRLTSAAAGPPGVPAGRGGDPIRWPLKPF